MTRSILLLVLLWTTLSFGQETSTLLSPTINCQIDNKPFNWTEYFSNDQLTIEYRFVECDPEIGFDQEQIILKMTNHTADELKIDWHILLEYDEICRTCDFPDEYNYTLFLKPNGLKEGDCSIYSKEFELKLFSKFIDERAKTTEALTSFQLSRLNVTRIPQE